MLEKNELARQIKVYMKANKTNIFRLSSECGVSTTSINKMCCCMKTLKSTQKKMENFLAGHPIVRAMDDMSDSELKIVFKKAEEEIKKRGI